MTTKPDLIKFIEDAIECRRGDDLYRARAAFRACTPEQMNEQHGQSGKTRRQIIDEYEQYEKKCNDAMNFFRSLVGGKVTP